MTYAVLHQLLAGASPGDAITDQAIAIRRWLQQLGFASEIYAEHIHEALQGDSKPLAAYRPKRQEKWVILHHSIGSSTVDVIRRLSQRIILIYHNITPPEFFDFVDPAWSRRMRRGREQLAELRRRTGLALADSCYNEQDLIGLGFDTTGVLPIALDSNLFDLSTDGSLWERLRDGRELLLFVGRIAPNKKQEDLVKLLFYLRRIRPSTRLALVGDRWLVGYDRWLQEFSRNLGLMDAVILPGQVSQQELITYYRAADLYVSMSEHEGFGKPLIESMYVGLPILAYNSTAVPFTLGEAGVLFNRKDYEALAEFVDVLLDDHHLQGRIAERQRTRVQAFLEPQVRRQLEDYLTALRLL